MYIDCEQNMAGAPRKSRKWLVMMTGLLLTACTDPTNTQTGFFDGGYSLDVAPTPKCTPGDGASCDDKKDCTVDSCDAEGNCKHDPLNGTVCGDGEPCVFEGVCMAGKCNGTAVDCDDGKSCTQDACHPIKGCVHTKLTEGAPCAWAGECREGACTGAALCGNGEVDPGETCDDGNRIPCDKCDNFCAGKGPKHMSGAYGVGVEGVFKTIPEALEALFVCDANGDTHLVLHEARYEQPGVYLGGGMGLSESARLTISPPPGRYAKLVGTDKSESGGRRQVLSIRYGFIGVERIEIDGNEAGMSIFETGSSPVLVELQSLHWDVRLVNLFIHDFSTVTKEGYRKPVIDVCGPTLLLDPTQGVVLSKLLIEGITGGGSSPSGSPNAAVRIEGGFVETTVRDSRFSNLSNISAIGLNWGWNMGVEVVNNMFVAGNKAHALELGPHSGEGGAAPMFVHNTIVMENNGPAIILPSNDIRPMVVRNNVFRSSGVTAKAFGKSVPEIQPDHNCFDSVKPGYELHETDVVGNAMLQSANQPWDLHLRPGSACIDKAVPGDLWLKTDIDGQPRGDKPDMGADEVQ